MFVDATHAETRGVEETAALEEKIKSQQCHSLSMSITYFTGTSEVINETLLTEPTQTELPHRLHFEPRTKNLSLSGLNGSLVTKHSSSNLKRQRMGQTYIIDGDQLRNNIHSNLK